jgi:plastocyanin
MRASSLVLPGLVAAVAVAAAPPSAESATTSVSVKDNVFAPKSKTVERGTTVRFVWAGRAPHNVVITGPRGRPRNRSRDVSLRDEGGF